jgi:hypothetical protein
MIPAGNAAFTEYADNCYDKLSVKLDDYGIPVAETDELHEAYDVFVVAEKKASNPDTATTGARRERDTAREKLTGLWRPFVNRFIRYNPLVPEADLEVFGIKKRDTTYTTAGIPDGIGVATSRRVGTCRFEVSVLDQTTGKKKHPQYATGSNLYVAVTEIGVKPTHDDQYQKKGFSSRSLHVIEFPLELVAKQANIYVRYSNRHGQEGPKGPVETLVIN